MSLLEKKQLSHGCFEVHSERPNTQIYSVNQVHGPDIVETSETEKKADGLCATYQELNWPLAIKTADCLPVVIEGTAGVVHLHAGWRGLACGILADSKIKDLAPERAYVGPSIQVCCFEVSEVFKENFPGNKNFEMRETLHFNLQAEAQDQLQKLYPGIVIEVSPTCTKCDQRFHSYRRGKEKSERNWNLYIKDLK